jgi:hypothetical protein
MLRNILFQLLALISNIVTQPWRQARFHTVWSVFETVGDCLSAGAASLPEFQVAVSPAHDAPTL